MFYLHILTEKYLNNSTSWFSNASLFCHGKLRLNVTNSYSQETGITTASITENSISLYIRIQQFSWNFLLEYVSQPFAQLLKSNSSTVFTHLSEGSLKCKLTPHKYVSDLCGRY
jgi:hypothetical protein